MLKALSSHVRRNVVGYVALFIALGGVAYANDGGPFILGRSNSASSPTQLSSPTGNAAGALKVTSTATSGGRAIQGTSAHGQGVYGHSGSNAGLVGDSNTFDGVFGVSNDTDSAGVSGHANGGGWGVWASGGNTLFHTSAIHGQSAAGNGVEGISGRDIASGVYGQNNSSGFGIAGRADGGTGVLGDSSNGWAFHAAGNAKQNLDRGGFVKAMLDYVPGTNNIRDCFNSQVPASQATSGDCGITVTELATGRYSVNFGFKATNRFVSVTPETDGTFASAHATVNNPLVVYMYNVFRGPEGDPFYIIVY